MSPVHRSQNRFKTPQVVADFTEPFLTPARVIPGSPRSQRLMTFIVNPSPCLSVVRQIAAVKILFTVLAMIAGGLPARTQSALATLVPSPSRASTPEAQPGHGFLCRLQQRFELRVQRDQQLDHSRIPAQRSHVLRQDVISVPQEFLSFSWPQNFAPRC